MELKDFIKLGAEKAANYDLKNLSPSKKVREESHSVKKLFLYKKEYQENREKPFECDGCELMREVYSKLYPNKDLTVLDFDTMNSFYTTYKSLLLLTDKDFWDNDIINFCKNLGINFKKIGSKQQYQLRYEWLLTDNVFNHYKDINNKPEVKRFATLTHTIGNMTLLPKGYNAGRAKSTKDYWDLTLISLQNFLESSFDHFVTEYYMQDFTTDTILFWEGHSFKKPEPKSLSKEQIFEVIEKINERIEKRSKRIFNALLEKES